MTGTEIVYEYKTHEGKFGAILECNQLGFNTTKDRKNKRYSSSVIYRFHSFARAGSDMMWANFEKHIQEKFASRIGFVKLKVEAFRAFAFNSPAVPEPLRSKENVQINVTFEHIVAAPRFIPTTVGATEREIIRRIDGSEDLIRYLILSGIEAALLETAEDKARKDRRQHADLIARNLAKRATKAAKEITNYETRLKALQEECDAKRKAILSEISEKLMNNPEEWKFTDGTMIDKRSINAGIIHAPEALKPLDSEGYFFPDENDMTKLEEV